MAPAKNITIKNHKADISIEEPPRIRFYRNRRFFRSCLMSIPILCFTGDMFVFTMTHIFATLFWDWWLFNVRGFKESETVPESYFKLFNITPKEMNTYASFIVNVRRIAIILGGIAYWIVFSSSQNQFFQEISLPLTYGLSTFLILAIAELLGKIKYPYPIGDSYHDTPHDLPGGSLYNAASDNLINNRFALSKQTRQVEYTTIKIPNQFSNHSTSSFPPW